MRYVAKVTFRTHAGEIKVREETVHGPDIVTAERIAVRRIERQPEVIDVETRREE